MKLEETKIKPFQIFARVMGSLALIMAVWAWTSQDIPSIMLLSSIMIAGFIYNQI